MGEPFAGRLSSWRSIWARCGRCLGWQECKRTDEPWGSHDDASRNLRRIGWSKTRKDGWVCPDCRARPTAPEGKGKHVAE